MRTLLLILILPSVAFSQPALQIRRGTILFDQDNLQYAGALCDTSTYLYVGSQSLTGAFNNIRNFYGAVNYQFSSERIKQSVGVGIKSLQTGELISENYVGSWYSLYLPLRSQFGITVAANAELINNSFKGTSVVAGGGDLGMTFGLSSMLRWKRHSVGVTLNQINSPELIPLGQPLIYPIFITGYMEAVLVKMKDFQLSILYQGIFYEINKIQRAKVQGIYQELFMGGIMVSKEELAFHVGVNRFRLGNHSTSIHMAYQTPLSQSTISSFSVLQVHLGYNF